MPGSERFPTFVAGEVGGLILIGPFPLPAGSAVLVALHHEGLPVVLLVLSDDVVAEPRHAAEGQPADLAHEPAGVLVVVQVGQLGKGLSASSAMELLVVTVVTVATVTVVVVFPVFDVGVFVLQVAIEIV